jgi:sugar fermentation stimulation protein A
MKFSRTLIRGRLVRRYKRFLADVRLPERGIDELITVHCPNTGSMKGCARPGSAVRLSTSDTPGRRYPHTWEMVRVGRAWVGINTILANRVAAEAIGTGLIPDLAGFDRLERERPLGGSSRVDILLSGPGRRRCYVEVKNVTLAENGVALFPDAVTVRGLKHLHELTSEVRNGRGMVRAAMLYLVQRTDCHSFRAAEVIDPGYAAGLHRAARAGVEVYPLLARVSPSGITPLRMLQWKK